MHPRVEQRQLVSIDRAVADAIEDLEQGLVVLAEDLRQFDQRRPGPLAQRRQTEKERPAVLRFQMLGDVGLVDHGRQLMQVAE